MDVNAFENVVGYRPSVIKWVGKDLTSDIIPKSNDRVPSTLGEQATSAQQNKQNKPFDESSEDHQAITINNDKSLFYKSNNVKNIYDCQTCAKSFKWRSHWKSHERIHTGERPFKCEICGKAFTRSDGLQCHKKVHLKIAKPCSTANQPHYTLGEDTVQDGIKKDNIFICAYCGRTFSSLAGYDRHKEKKHKDKEDLKCLICNTIFNRPSALETHNRVHTGLKPHTCDICSKAFSIRGNLKRHLLTHRL